MLYWCMSRGFLWAGVAAFPCHQQSHLQGEVSLPLPAPSSNSFKCRSFEQNLDPLETILWQFWRLSWVLCIFLQHNIQYVPLDPPELISTLFICEKMPNLLGDNFGNLQMKRCFILRGIPWIGTFSVFRTLVPVRTKSQSWDFRVSTGMFSLTNLGKPSFQKSAVFLNIVQKAFDPPPLLFEHLSYFAGGVFWTRFWAFDIMYLFYPQISPSMPQKSLFMQISCC